MDGNQNLNAQNSPTQEDENTGVKKLNKRPVYVVIVTLIIILLSLGYAMYQRGQMNKKAEEEKETKKIDSDANGLIKSLLEDLKNKKKSETNMTFIFPEAKLDDPKIDMGVPTDNEIKDQVDEEALKLAKLKEQLLMNAITASTQIKNNLAEGAGTSASNALTKVADGLSSTPGLDIMNQIKNLSGATTDGSMLTNEAFIEQSKKKTYYIDSVKTKQLSPYELKAGTIIPGILITAINSELPGQILGQVSENVYDTATGNYMLIPQGTKMIGEYNADVVYGQSRAMIAWNRLVFPDGQTLDIGAMNGTDQSGVGGFEDQVNNHYLKVFGSAFLLTLLNGDMTIQNGELVIMRQSTLTERKETAIEKAAAKVIEKQMDVAPTIEIRSGYRFNIFVTRDMILEPL